MTIGIMCAMHEEIKLLHQEMTVTNESIIGGRTYYEGKLNGKNIVIVFSRWGKVASSSTATTLIERFRVDKLIFSGVAGSIDYKFSVGDIIIGEKLIQHDMDASPLFDKFEIPLIGIKHFETNYEISQSLLQSAKNFLNSHIFENSVKNDFNLSNSKVALGNIASGDQFISNSKTIRVLNKELPDYCCVEMEGAAVAQICHEYGIPFGIVRLMFLRA